jgi:LAS superfamily LD-carboxypeptidase LdcB
MANTPVVVPDTGTIAAVDNSYLLGKFNPSTHPDFVAVGVPYSDKGDMRLRKEAFQAFEKMWKAAKKDGVTLNIISSTRNFDKQKKIWEDKWERFAAQAPKPIDRALKILEYSSMPGSSRHHWGTDIDLNDLNNPSFEAGGKYEKVYKWLSAHAHEYGFCQPYTAGRPSGYHEEKWHWSYTPLSKGFLENYKQNITEANITGFNGSETATAIAIVKNYVLGINQACQ